MQVILDSCNAMDFDYTSFLPKHGCKTQQITLLTQYEYVKHNLHSLSLDAAHTASAAGGGMDDGGWHVHSCSCSDTKGDILLEQGAGHASVAATG